MNKMANKFTFLKMKSRGFEMNINLYFVEAFSFRGEKIYAFVNGGWMEVCEDYLKICNIIKKHNRM